MSSGGFKKYQCCMSLSLTLPYVPCQICFLNCPLSLFFQANIVTEGVVINYGEGRRLQNGGRASEVLPLQKGGGKGFRLPEGGGGTKGFWDSSNAGA